MIGGFTIIKNEEMWIGFNIMSFKDVIGEFVYFDGNSTDGTVPLLKHLRDKYNLNIKIFENKDPENLQDAYVDMFNECLGQVKSDYAWYLHPDFICVKPPETLGSALCCSVKMRSFAGNPRGEIYEFTSGRTDKWKNIYKNDLGLHFYGYYGAANEDFYFKDITGNQHELYRDFSLYPYAIEDSGAEVFHYSDVRPYARRYNRMIACLKNQYPQAEGGALAEAAKNHPRVSLVPNKSFGAFKLSPVTEFPEVFTKYVDEFANVCGKKPEEFCYLPIKEAVNV